VRVTAKANLKATVPRWLKARVRVTAKANLKATVPRWLKARARATAKVRLGRWAKGEVKA
jgi:DNA-nicking Smr family endonuclease